MTEKTLFEKQREFMVACDMKAPAYLETYADGNLNLWMSLVHEEYKELVKSFEDGVALAFDRRMDVEDLTEIASEAVDVIYVTAGLLNSMGIDGQMVFDAIHEANMAKVGTDGKVTRRADGKILKPEGWKKANVKAILMAQQDDS